jgi:hypothetical protein
MVMSEYPKYSASLDLVFDGMRKPGVPEQKP